MFDSILGCHRLACRTLRCSLMSTLMSTSMAMLMATMPAMAEKVSVLYPKPESENDERGNYQIKLLNLALSKSGANYAAAPTKVKMLKSRALAQLAAGEDVDVVWSMTSKQREADLLAIRIPLDKGLLGWRIFLISKKNKAAFAQIKALDDLKKLTAGQGHDWPDTEILRSNQLKVQPGASYDGLFKMLDAGNIDYFPRSVMEIWDEQKSHADLGLEIEGKFILQYPTAMYYFVSKKNKALATALETGLKKAISDGSFEQLFNQTHADIIKRANLKGRTRFQLSNPLLPPETPLQQKELWLQF